MPVSSASQPPTPFSSRRIQLTLAELLVLLPAVPAACCVVTAYVIDALGGPIHPWLIAAVLIVAACSCLACGSGGAAGIRR